MIAFRLYNVVGMIRIDPTEINVTATAVLPDRASVEHGKTVILEVPLCTAPQVILFAARLEAGHKTEVVMQQITRAIEGGPDVHSSGLVKSALSDVLKMFK